jgi:hypothetical protein
MIDMALGWRILSRPRGREHLVGLEFHGLGVKLDLLMYSSSTTARIQSHIPSHSHAELDRDTTHHR